MERLQSSTAEWHAYVAGFFDGEGSVSIARVRANGLSDYHKIVVQIGQRTEHAAVLDRIAAEFGGIVRVQLSASRVNRLWAKYSKWQLQGKPDIQAFLEVIAPYSIIKAEPIRIGLEFVRSFTPAATYTRNAIGQYAGKRLTRQHIEHREHLRLAMLHANRLGPPKVLPSILPPLDVRHRD